MPACVQLDHVADLARIEAAFALGCGAVMADGSRLPGRRERGAGARRRRAGRPHRWPTSRRSSARLEGDEDVARAVAAGAFTDPDEAERFVAATGAACLAVSIGNVHGTYRHPPRLDLERLEAHPRSALPVPLSLHGASGIEERSTSPPR